MKWNISYYNSSKHAFLKEMAKDGDDIKFVKIPNAITRKAMKAVDKGQVTKVKNSDDLFRKE